MDNTGGWESAGKSSPSPLLAAHLVSIVEANTTLTGDYDEMNETGGERARRG
jgi:hypothetical protein